MYMWNNIIFFITIFVLKIHNFNLCAAGRSGSIWRTVELRVDKFFPPLNSVIRAPFTAKTGLLLPSNSSACDPHNVSVT